MGHISEFGKILIILLTGILLVTLTLLLSKMLAPKKPTPLKLSSYECGEETSGNSWVQFNSRFYVIALIFLLFDVEMIFIFPWSTVFAQKELLAVSPSWGWLTLTEMFVFVGILLLGLVYVWKRGDLEWIKPEPKLPEVKTAIPASAYDRINQETYKIRPFSVHSSREDVIKESSTSVTGTKPAFKPTFKRVQK
ncbi:NADH-quinone oxidoreductase subunit A [Pararcticibacter amylolyticus]|uniref:NADH-quinone oxidoreductase subunit A n=1 Tax=Pararcticibacter amylolyticus TaxID=2173175 RepID=A0A2U2PHN6_9SPHI|nr:NADH-quinone oxidoreductase subunit A [Pararcticibacter amylolyticus]PWG80923.1 NADH-quinone oxidoreductase subunit A [Pararcticibacter amylolyticus]